MSLSAQDLYELDDRQVRVQAANMFTAFIHNGPSVVRFFPISSQAPLRKQPLARDWVDGVACALVCSSIGRSSLFGFQKTVNVTAADAYWAAQLGSANAIAEGQDAYRFYFPEECVGPSGNFFGTYEQDAARWAAELAQHVSTPAFKNILVNQLSAGQPEWTRKLNLTLYKLHRLDPAKESAVLDAWKDIPSIRKEWQSYSYIPPVAPDAFLGDVNAVISQKTQSFSPGHGRDGGTTTDTYGAQVLEFLKGRPTPMGFATGVSPDNTFDHHHSPGGCFIAGTPVLLAGGTTKAIEMIEEGDAVLAENGAISVHSDERVIVELENDTRLYGINDSEPFFSAAHIFRTRGGWKALDPTMALEENPTGRAVGQLAIGDILLRVVSVEPFAYEEVRIDRLPSRVIRAGSHIYGLHLLGERSYHAGGFLVAMNYPLITARRLANGFAMLSESERRLIARQLEPIFPLLAKAVGSFIEAPLRRAIAGHHADSNASILEETR